MAAAVGPEADHELVATRRALAQRPRQRVTRAAHARRLTPGDDDLAGPLPPDEQHELAAGQRDDRVLAAIRTPRQLDAPEALEVAQRRVLTLDLGAAHVAQPVALDGGQEDGAAQLVDVGAGRALGIDVVRAGGRAQHGAARPCGGRARGSAAVQELGHAGLRRGLEPPPLGSERPTHGDVAGT
jgi:hypothetical protein